MTYPDSLKGYFPGMQSSARTLCSLLASHGEGCEVDIWRELQKMTLEVVGTAAFGCVPAGCGCAPMLCASQALGWHCSVGLLQPPATYTAYADEPLMGLVSKVLHVDVTEQRVHCAIWNDGVPHCIHDANPALRRDSVLPHAIQATVVRATIPR